MTENYLYREETDNLTILIQEVMRASPDGTRRFIEPSYGVLNSAKSRQHHIVFGRRGSGKSSLLRKAANDLTLERKAIAFIDLESFKAHSYPDVLVSILLKSMSEYRDWLRSAAVEPSNKSSFWKRFFGIPSKSSLNKKEVENLGNQADELINKLNEILFQPSELQRQEKNVDGSESTLTASISSDLSKIGTPLSTTLSGGKKETHSKESNLSYTSRKIEYLHQNVFAYQQFFKNLSRLTNGMACLFLDDLYHIRKSDQAEVLDYFHKIAKGNDLWIKVGTIRYRSEWYRHKPQSVGMKLGDDAVEINLDVTLEQYNSCKTFLTKVLTNLLGEAGIPSVSNMANDGAIDRLVIASGGVARDFVGIFGKAIKIARDRGEDHHRGPRICVEDVNKASGEYDSHKREELKRDSEEEEQSLLDSLQSLTDFCTGTAKSNVFLINKKTNNEEFAKINELLDLRLVHHIRSRTTVKSGRAGQIFDAYMLDISQYTASRKVHDIKIVDLSKNNSDDEFRRAGLIYM